MRLTHLVFVAALSACRGKHDAAPPPAKVVEEPPLPKLSANDATIALGNLDGQIKDLEARTDRNGGLAAIEMLSMRGQYLGCIADYEKASAIAERLKKESPENTEVLVAHASTLATFHRFDDALAELSQAETLGAKADRLARPRASIFAARGKYAEAAELSKADEATMNAMQLASAGVLAGEMGKLAEAERLLDAARNKYPDVSPFPLAWIDVQQAKLYESRGLREKARRHYERALQLLPMYAVAASHLAAMSTPEKAIEILKGATRTDDPEALVQLADAHRRAGHEADAKTALGAAIERYGLLLERHPEAFADHAAAMWLGPGKDPQRALALAKVNVAVRTTSEAVDLWLTAANAAKDERETCAAAKTALALPYPTDDLKALAGATSKRCPAP